MVFLCEERPCTDVSSGWTKVDPDRKQLGSLSLRRSNLLFSNDVLRRSDVFRPELSEYKDGRG